MNDILLASASQLVAVLREKKLTASTAESCTGGLVGAAVTAVPRSSEVFLGGVISYAVDVKEKVLHVSDATVEKYGVVSEQCAAEMAVGAAALVGADIAVSVTGIAGPGGGTDVTPVGTVCFGVSCKGIVKCFTHHFDASGGRESVREAAAAEALRAILDAARNL